MSSFGLDLQWSHAVSHASVIALSQDRIDRRVKATSVSIEPLPVWQKSDCTRISKPVIAERSASGCVPRPARQAALQVQGPALGPDDRRGQRQYGRPRVYCHER